MGCCWNIPAGLTVSPSLTVISPLEAGVLELCGFVLFYFGVEESVRGGERKGAGL